MKNMQIKDKKRIINNIKVTMAVEKQDLDKKGIELLEDYADGKITMDEAMSLIKNMVLGKA